MDLIQTYHSYPIQTLSYPKGIGWIDRDRGNLTRVVRRGVERGWGRWINWNYCECWNGEGNKQILITNRVIGRLFPSIKVIILKLYTVLICYIYSEQLTYNIYNLPLSKIALALNSY